MKKLILIIALSFCISDIFSQIDSCLFDRMDLKAGIGYINQDEYYNYLQNNKEGIEQSFIFKSKPITGFSIWLNVAYKINKHFKVGFMAQKGETFYSLVDESIGNLQLDHNLFAIDLSFYYPFLNNRFMFEIGTAVGVLNRQVTNIYYTKTIIKYEGSLQENYVDFHYENYYKTNLLDYFFADLDYKFNNRLSLGFRYSPIFAGKKFVTVLYSPFLGFRF